MLARAQTPQGEVALRRRGDVVELIVNGVFAMDSAEVTSELVLVMDGLRAVAGLAG